jgi:succinyl-CoA synthetase beta subunit
MDLLEYQGKQLFRKHGAPVVGRLDGTNDAEGRRLLAEAGLPGVHTESTMLGAAERVVEPAG